MSKINYKILKPLEDLLGMESGYVLDFSNLSFQRFVKAVIDIDIYEDEGYELYCSKANKLRQIFETESTSKVTKLINELLDYYEDIQLKNNSLTDYDKKKIYDIKKETKKVDEGLSETGYHITKELDDLFKLISTRQAPFKKMSLDEKLKEIGNLIENLLKKNGKYIKINFREITLDFIEENDVKQLRSKLNCFRHSSEDSLKERNEYTKIQKQFMVEYGITICNLIYKFVRKDKSVST